MLYYIPGSEISFSCRSATAVVVFQLGIVGVLVHIHVAFQHLNNPVIPLLFYEFVNCGIVCHFKR